MGLAFLLWGAVCVVLTLAIRPATIAVVGLAIYVAIPFTALYGHGTLVTQFGALHPATILVTVAGALWIAHSQVRQTATHPPLHPAFGIAFAAILICYAVTALGHGQGGLGFVTNMMTAPWCLAILLVIDARPVARKRRLATRGILVLGLAQATLAIAIWFGTVGQPYRLDFYDQYWFASSVAAGRMTATLDHPLVLSLLLVASTCAALSLRRIWVQIALCALLVSGVLVTESRTGLALIGLALVFQIVRSNVTTSRRLTLMAVVAVADIALLRSSVSAGVLGRIANDSGSAGARGDAWSIFAHVLPNYLAVGDGAGSSYGVAAAAGLTTSFESPVIMYTIDFGLVASVAYFGAITTIALSRRCKVPANTRLMVICTLAGVLSYSSLATYSAASPIMWFVLGIVALEFSPSARRSGLAAIRADSPQSSLTPVNHASAAFRPSTSGNAR